jgi:hypothetical protein
LTSPAAAIEDLQAVLGGLLGAQKGRDQDLPRGLEFTNFQGGGCSVVLLLAHPLRLLFGFGVDDAAIARTELLAYAEVGAALARSVLLEQAVDAATLQLAEQKV